MQFIRHVIAEFLWQGIHTKAQTTLAKARAGPHCTVAWVLWELKLHQQG